MNNAVDVEIWHFRVERHDARGNRLETIPVEMRGISYSGSVSNGDQVHVSGRWRRGTLHAEELMNLTTRAQVKGKFSGRLTKVAMVFAIIFVLAVIGFLVSVFISVGSGPAGPPKNWPPTPP
ncbi:hypothetical protein [Streptomyces sp. NPDC057939]|uniref:hypothetical protein n=1 Tax=Streptomyces sp. NPDC057939 TaxID=3346284 RepID=UPI0036F1026A